MERKMKTQKISIYILLVILFCHTFVFSQTKVGTTIAPFLGISATPRATALGGAFVAVANDVTTLYYNPGGLSRISGTEFLFSRTSWLVDSELNWIGFGVNLDGASAIGASLTYLNYGEEEVTTTDNPEGTGDTWAANDFAAAVSYSRNLTDRFSIGGSVKYIQQKVYNETGSAYALDIGLLFTTQFNDIKLGMSICNFGTDLKYDGKDLLHRVDLDENVLGNTSTIIAKLKTESYPLPLFFRVGLAMDLLKSEMNRLTVAVDAFRPSDNNEIINLGAEYGFNNWAFLRAGYKSLFRKDSEEGLTFGGGINLNLGSAGVWAVDYCYMDFGVFEGIHMISFKVGM
jgi:hypothetical protein